MLASSPKEWFGVKSIHRIPDADLIRFRLAQRAAEEVLAPPQKGRK